MASLKTRLCVVPAWKEPMVGRRRPRVTFAAMIGPEIWGRLARGVEVLVARGKCLLLDVERPVQWPPPLQPVAVFPSSRS